MQFVKPSNVPILPCIALNTASDDTGLFEPCVTELSIDVSDTVPGVPVFVISVPDVPPPIKFCFASNLPCPVADKLSRSTLALLVNLASPVADKLSRSVFALPDNADCKSNWSFILPPTAPHVAEPPPPDKLTHFEPFHCKQSPTCGFVIVTSNKSDNKPLKATSAKSAKFGISSSFVFTTPFTIEETLANV